MFCLVISASFLISSATTAKPFPCSPALAASMAAFRARRKDQLQLRGMLLASDRGEDGAGCTGVGHAAVTELMQQWETGKQNPGRSFCREMRCERLETTLRRSFLLRGADRW